MNIKKSIRIITTLSLLILLTVSLSLAQDRFPGRSWDRVSQPENLGYSTDKLQLAENFTKSIRTAAVVIVVDGIILDEWGDVEGKYMTHSIRKSFLSAMYGNYVRKGTIDLDKTVEEFGIDDVPPLTGIEKQATLRDILKARSGIYHAALYETAGMRRLKPERHTKNPGEFWYYNNWDFNASGTLFEKLTGKKIFEALEAEIAKPIGMEHFEAEDGWYVTGDESIHPAYPFRITAHDMARFGLLMLRKGNWNGDQVIPEDWVEESTAYYSDAALYSSDGYGYMWWVAKEGNRFPHLRNVSLKDGTYSARGAGGHYILIIPDRDMIIVHRVNTDERGHSVSGRDMGTLTNMILDAKIN